MDRSIGIRLGGVVVAVALVFGAPPALAADPSPVPPARSIVYQAWQPDGSTRIHLVGWDGSDDRPLLATPLGDEGHPDWSPEAGRVAFDLFLPGNPQPVEVWVAGADGSAPTRVASCTAPCLQLSYPAWSPDGTQLAMIRYDVTADGAWGPSAVEVLTLADGTRRTVTQTADGATAFYEPAWSPDGDTIAVTIESYTDASEETRTGAVIAVVPAVGGDPVTISDPSIVASQPDWAPAGRIAFTAQDDVDAGPTAMRVMTMEPDGSDVRDVSSASLPFAGEPSWMDEATLAVVTADPANGSQWLAILGADGGFSRRPWVIDETGGIQRLHVGPGPW